MANEPEENSQKDQLRSVLEEARMVLPGIQALFGFQTVAVFNQRFEKLAIATQMTHLVALFAIVLAIALAMMPAAWHRIVEPDRVSHTTVTISSKLISAALFPLTVGLTLDIYVVVLAVTGSAYASIASATAVFFLLSGLWFVIPLLHRR